MQASSLEYNPNSFTKAARPCGHRVSHLLILSPSLSVGQPQWPSNTLEQLTVTHTPKRNGLKGQLFISLSHHWTEVGGQSRQARGLGFKRPCKDPGSLHLIALPSLRVLSSSGGLNISVFCGFLGASALPICSLNPTHTLHVIPSLTSFHVNHPWWILSFVGLWLIRVHKGSKSIPS